MEIHLLAKQFPLTPALRKHVERRLRSGLLFARDRIGDVVVRLGDVNGPRGGQDMLCQILVALPGQPSVVVRDVQDDLYTAIDRAARRVAWKVRKMVTQRRTLARWGHRSPVKAMHALAPAGAEA